MTLKLRVITTPWPWRDLGVDGDWRIARVVESTSRTRFDDDDKLPSFTKTIVRRPTNLDEWSRWRIELTAIGLSDHAVSFLGDPHLLPPSTTSSTYLPSRRNAPTCLRSADHYHGRHGTAEWSNGGHTTRARRKQPAITIALLLARPRSDTQLIISPIPNHNPETNMSAYVYNTAICCSFI